MSQLPINNTFVAPVTVVSNTENYWVVNNPIIGKMVGAHDVDNHTIRIGDGKTKYKNLNPITYIGSSGTAALPQMATEEDPGMVPCLATQLQVLEGSGHGAVMSNHMAAVFDKIRLMVSSNVSTIGAVGERAFKPWNAPKPGWKVMNGQYVEMDDPVYNVLKQYLEDNPYEVITPNEYDTFLNTPDPDGPGGVGGVHFYALYPDGRIRLPDTRGDYVNASGLDGQPLQWKVDAIRNIAGNFARGHVFSSAAGAFRQLSDPSKTYAIAALTSGSGGENYVGFSAANVVPTDTHNHPRGASYLSVVYLGTGEEYLSENGLIFLAETRSKYLGEIFTYNGKIAPPGAFHLNGQDVSKTIYKSLFDHATKYELFKSRAEWDAEYASNFTNVDFYAYDEGDDTFRLPTYNPADRYWPTDGILCVQAYHAVIESGTITPDHLVDQVFNKLDYPKTKLYGDSLYVGADSRMKFSKLIEPCNVCMDAADIVLMKNGLIPNYETVFNTWKRFSMKGNVQPGSADELLAWSYDKTTDTFKNTTNSVTVIGCVTPETYIEYDFEVLLTSTDPDDDTVGLILAYVEDEDGWQNALVARRSPGGNFPWSVTHNMNVTGRPTNTLTNQIHMNGNIKQLKWGNGKYGTNGTAAEYVANKTLTGLGTAKGWQGLPKGVRLLAKRRGNIITVETTDWLDFDNEEFIPTAKITIDLTSNPAFYRYHNPCSIGLAAFSQAHSTWSDIVIKSPQNSIIDYSVSPPLMHAYNGKTDKWDVTTLPSDQRLSVGKLYFNTVTNKLFTNFNGRCVCISSS